MPELQTIPARHGVATFVPAGQVIKIINTSGTQVVDTWAFALPKPDSKKGEEPKIDEKDEESNTNGNGKPATEEKAKPKPAPSKKGKKDGNELPSQEDAEQATREGIAQGEQEAGQNAGGKAGQQQKSSWSSYVPSIGWKKGGDPSQQQSGKDKQTQQQKDSKTWASYFPSGKAFGNYIPKTASDTVSSFTNTHQRDPNKSYLEQLQDFSKTPVGAAGMSVMTGSGYSSSLYAGYQAWNATNAADAPMMEFMSMPHTRAGTLHIRPKVNDTLLSNLREPILTMVEDSSPGIHDTLMAACDPQRYAGLGVDKWEEHGSCAENLVLALKELNERAGLKGAKGVGADVMINNVPAPLNLFMNIPWNDPGDLSFDAPKSKEGDFVRLKAERDVVVVMSACPQDILDINNNKPTDANFIVEGDDTTGDDKQKRQTPRKRPAPRKINSSTKPPSTVATGDMGDDDKSQVGSTPAKKPLPRKAPAKKPATGPKAPAKAGDAPQQPAKKKPIPRPSGTPAKVKESGAGGETNGTATPPAVEKKKPRKLNKPAAPAGEKKE